MTTFTSMGSQVGETVSVSNYSSLSDFEEKSAKLLGSSEWHAVAKKFEGLIVPARLATISCVRSSIRSASPPLENGADPAPA